jgi:error-prone DNA polymerase
MSGLAVTDHGGLYSVVRFATEAGEAGLRPIIGVEIELADPAVPDLAGVAMQGGAGPRRGHSLVGGSLAGGSLAGAAPLPDDAWRGEGLPSRPRPARARLPGHRDPVREDLRGVGEGQRGPHLVLLARNGAGYRSLCRLVSRANLAGTKSMPRFSHALLADNTDGLVALSGCREGEIARRLRAGDREGARTAAERYARMFGGAGTEGGMGNRAGAGIGAATPRSRARGDSPATAAFFMEMQHHLLPDDDWLVAETARLAEELGLPVVVTNDVHYAYPEGREMQDVLTAIRHGRALDGLRDLRRPDGESYLKGADELMALPPGRGHSLAGGGGHSLAGGGGHSLAGGSSGVAGHETPDEGAPRGGDTAVFSGAGARTTAAWVEGIGNAGELAASCSVDLGFERYRFPGFPVPKGNTPFSYLEELCHEGARRRYHPISSPVVKQLAHELDVIERTGLAEFFLICADIMRFARERGIPAQGRGSAANSIVAYVLGITRVDPIRHHLLFERFINEGRTSYPDIDIDFSSERREEVIQYVYGRYGPEHTGMVCNLVTYRARSAVREVGYALGFPRPLVDRVAKALETYDAVMVRRDLEADGGFGQFFAETVERVAERVADGRRSPLAERSATALAQRDGDRRPSNPGPPEARRGSAAALPHWERWLAFCARIDGFPRHLSIHSGGMLVTAAPLIDIAPLERATMPGRVVVQFDKRDVETLKLIKLDLLGLGMLAAIDETLQLIERDCAASVDLDRLPEDVPEVFAMIQAADTVGVFQVESRAQMQTLPKSKPANLDDLVVEVAIIRPGPIQGNAVHPYLRRRQGLEQTTYLHPSLEPVLRETLGVILYQEQVMNIAVTVAGFTPAESDGFRRAMGTWRSSREMEKLHRRFVDGCRTTNGLTDEQAEELFRQVAAFASFGFAKSHAAAFARTAYESAFLKLFYPAQFTVGLINAQPMGFYPVEVLINDARRHGVAVLPVDVNESSYKTTTEWVGLGPVPDAIDPADREPSSPRAQRSATALARSEGRLGSWAAVPGAPRFDRPAAVKSSGCVVPSNAARARWTPESTTGYGIRLGLSLVKGIGDEHAERLDAELARGPYRSLADVVDRTGLPEETIERLIRAGALDSLGRPRRELLWQLREVMGATRGRVGGRSQADGRSATPGGRSRTGGGIRRAAGVGGARPMDLRLPPTPAPELPPLTELERLGDSYAVLSLDARRQVVSLFRPALERLGAVTNASLADRGPGPVMLGGLVVTRQHPMTAHGTVFLTLEDETGMANVTLWPDVWGRLRGVVRRHALLYVEGTLQREANVVNVIAHDIRPLPAVAEAVGGPARPEGVRALGYSGLRRG